MKKPELSDIKDLYETLKSEYGDLMAQDIEMAALDAMTYDVPHCEPDIANYTPHVIRSGWTRHAIKAMVALFPRPEYRHMAGMGTTNQRLSEDIEAFLNNVPWAIEAKYGAFWTPGVENAGVFGRGWIEVLPKRKRWVSEPDYPKKGKGINPKTGEPVASDEGADAYKVRREEWKKDMLPPVSIRFLPADQVFALVTEQYRVLKAVRYAEITLEEAKTKWPDKFGDVEGDPTDAVSVYEYVDEEWVAQGASYSNEDSTTEDFVTPPWRHGMRVCPWVLMEALTTASTDPNKRWEPWLREAKEVGIAMDAQLTRKAMITEIWPMPQPHLNLKASAPDGVEKGYEMMELAPPKTLVTYDDAQFQIHPWSQSEPGAEELWAKLREAMDRALPNVGSEIAEGSSGTPAWTWRLRGQMLDRDMKTVADNLSLSAKRVGQTFLRALLSQWINEPVYFGHKTKEGSRVIKLNPKEDIAGQVNRIEATVRASKLIDRNSNLGAMKLAVDMGLGKRWALQELGEYENPQEILDEAEFEAVEYSEPMRQQRILDIMKRADLLQAQDNTVSPAEVQRLGPLMPPGIQAALGLPSMTGLGTTGIPQGAAPTTLTRTGVGTPQQGGPTPFAPGPGEAEVVPGP